LNVPWWWKKMWPRLRTPKDLLLIESVARRTTQRHIRQWIGYEGHETFYQCNPSGIYSRASPYFMSRDCSSIEFSWTSRTLACFWEHVTESRLCLGQAYVYSPWMTRLVPVSKYSEDLWGTRQDYEHAQILVKSLTCSTIPFAPKSKSGTASWWIPSRPYSRKG
jgi:hypothetical protein